ncbi:MAG TPA: RNA polymerase subunit sigma-70, partial [Planctomycetaceae bacterium]|nr:RNA polymerase subunit sigma-70 [Planctomycetaceae bacterium]
HWKSTGKWEKLKCLELIMVCGMANRAVADQLNIPQTQVANYKFEFVTRVRDRVKSQRISADIFPELADQTNEISDA